MGQSIFHVARYSSDGDLISTDPLDPATLDGEHINAFSSRLQLRSKDLELPLEGRLPVDSDSIEFSFNSSSDSAAYTIYFLDEEAVVVSLYLNGDSDEAMELLQVIRCLLLEEDDDDDRTDEELEAILDDDRFDFESIEQRPAMFTVTIPTDADDEPLIDHISRMDRHLAAAFFSL